MATVRTTPPKPPTTPRTTLNADQQLRVEALHAATQLTAGPRTTTTATVIAVARTFETYLRDGQ